MEELRFESKEWKLVVVQVDDLYCLVGYKVEDGVRVKQGTFAQCTSFEAVKASFRLFTL